MAGAEVSVVIPVWNRRDLLEQLLPKLREQTCAIAEVLVIDNGSTDGAAECAEKLGAKVVRMGHNAGFCRAVNRGIETCRTPWIAILNNDVQPEPAWLERLVFAAETERAWFATGKLLDNFRRDHIDGTYDAICRGGCAWRVGHGRPDGPEFSRQRSIWMAPATAALYRAELFKGVGLFDECFESYLEDVDFGLRCALLERAGLYVPDAVAFHAGSSTLGRWHPQTVRRIARNQLLLVSKHYPRALLFRLAWPILVAQALWGLVALRHGAGGPYLRGKLEALRMLGKSLEKADAVRLSQVLEESEGEIRETQQRTGFDQYWRWYFRLT